MANILAVEDCEETQPLLTRALDRHHKLEIVDTAKSAQHSLDNKEYDLILLDLNLPDGNGFDVLNYLQDKTPNTQTPVIILSAREETEDKVRGFTLGAEDYVTKPFVANELLARIQTRLKNKNKSTVFERDLLKLEPSYQKVFKVVDNQNVDLGLTPIEFKILFTLISSPGKPINRNDLINKVWSSDQASDSRGIDAHISNLRKKLGSPHSRYIQAIYKVGYVYRKI